MLGREVNFSQHIAINPPHNGYSNEKQHCRCQKDAAKLDLVYRCFIIFWIYAIADVRPNGAVKLLGCLPRSV